MNLFWMAVQVAVFFAVIYSEKQYGWGHGGSGLAIGVVAALAAFLVTAIPFAIYDLAIRAKAFLLRRRKRVHYGRDARAASSGAIGDRLITHVTLDGTGHQQPPDNRRR